MKVAASKPGTTKVYFSNRTLWNWLELRVQQVHLRIGNGVSNRCFIAMWIGGNIGRIIKERGNGCFCGTIGIAPLYLCANVLYPLAIVGGLDPFTTDNDQAQRGGKRERGCRRGCCHARDPLMPECRW